MLIDWYSDGWLARLGLIAVSIVLLTLLVRSARSCPPLIRLMRRGLFWHFIVFVGYVFWQIPYYGERSDVFIYHNSGIEIAQLIRAGQWGDLPWALGTKAVDIIIGLLYAPFGADIYGCAIFSAVLGFGSAVYLCRAFSLWATPEQTRKYSLIVLFLPSFSVWTSIIGKDSWIALGVGLAAFGYSNMNRSATLKGLGHFVLGFLITIAIRPHIALAIAGSMAGAYIWGLTRRNVVSLPMKLFRIAVLISLVGGLYPLTLRFAGFSDDASAGNVEEYMERSGEANAAGGSVVEVQTAPGIVGAIRGFPRAVVRVLLEPFPWEVHNLNAALAAAENLFVGWFILMRARRLRRMVGEVIRRPYFLFAFIITIGLLAMFSYVPNLGLLSRQRAQLLPFLFAVLVAGDLVRPRRAVQANIVRTRWSKTTTPLANSAARGVRLVS